MNKNESIFKWMFYSVLVRVIDSNTKSKILAICFFIGAIMTVYPPQTVITHDRFTQPTIEYLFIGSGGAYNQTTEIAIDRLLLQYLILAGLGFGVYFLFSGKKDE